MQFWRCKLLAETGGKSPHNYRFSLSKHTTGNKLADKGAYLSVSGRSPPVQPTRELCRLTRFVALRLHLAFAQGLATISQELRRLAEFRRSKKWQNSPLGKISRWKTTVFGERISLPPWKAQPASRGDGSKTAPANLCEMSLRSRRVQANRLEGAATAAKRFPPPEETAAAKKPSSPSPCGRRRRGAKYPLPPPGRRTRVLRRPVTSQTHRGGICMNYQETDPEFAERFEHFAFEEVPGEPGQQLDG